MKLQLYLIGAALALLVCVVEAAYCQSYPSWFLNQGSIKCGSAVVGYASPSFYRDSSISQAAHNAAVNVGRLQMTHISGGQAFWSTEGGTYWMGTSIREEFDTTAAVKALSSQKVLDAFVTLEFVAVLCGDSTCVVDPSLRSTMQIRALAPPWTESIPRDEQFVYAVGMAPEYYYELSSWQEAERAARLNLARNVYTNIKALQKVSGREGQEIRNEEMAVTLKQQQIVARWRDPRQKIFYVLIRMPKSP